MEITVLERRDFLLKINNSVVENLISLLENRTSGLSSWIDCIMGFRWIPLKYIVSQDTVGLQDVFVCGKPTYINYDGFSIKAFGKTCSQCRTNTEWLPQEKVIKCLNCCKEYSIQQEKGTLRLEKYYTKIENDNWYIQFS